MSAGSLRLSEHSDDGWVGLHGSAVQVVGEEDGDLVTLQIFLIAVELLVVFE